MKILLDSANIDEIKQATDWNVIDGVTTNPTLISEEIERTKLNSEDIILNILDIINDDQDVHIETSKSIADEIIQESVELIDKYGDNINIVTKIPVTFEGLKAISSLDNEGLVTNATLVFSINQAILAAKAGADYVSIFVGRLDDIGHDGMAIVKDTVNIFENYCIETEVIAASIRHPLHVIEATNLGTHIITVPFNILEKMIKHPLTDIGIKKFNKDLETYRIE